MKWEFMRHWGTRESSDEGDETGEGPGAQV